MNITNNFNDDEMMNDAIFNLIIFNYFNIFKRVLYNKIQKIKYIKILTHKFINDMNYLKKNFFIIIFMLNKLFNLKKILKLL